MIPRAALRQVPEFDEEKWDFRVEGLVENPLKLNYGEFLALESTISLSDLHCVLGQNKLELKWKGVRFSTITRLAKLGENARFATIEAEGGTPQPAFWGFNGA